MAHSIKSIRAMDDRRVVSEPSPVPSRMLPAMPLQILHFLSPVEVSYQRLSGDVVFKIARAQSLEPPPDIVSAYGSRDVFLTIRRPGEALDFLSVTGFFRFRESTGREVETLTWSEFKRWQEFIGILVTRGFIGGHTSPHPSGGATMHFDLPEHLKDLIPNMTQIEQGFLYRFPEGLIIKAQPDIPSLAARPSLFAEIHVRTTLEAILATNYVDSLSGVNYGLCALPDCNRAFEITSTHKREYCSQACAHKASVRRRRAERKQAESRTSASEPIHKKTRKRD